MMRLEPLKGSSIACGRSPGPLCDVSETFGNALTIWMHWCSPSLSPYRPDIFAFLLPPHRHRANEERGADRGRPQAGRYHPQNVALGKHGQRFASARMVPLLSAEKICQRGGTSQFLHGAPLCC